MSGTITTGISFDLDMIKEIDEITSDLGVSRSRFIQISARNQIKLHRKQSVKAYLDTLSEGELIVLKNEIKKRS